MRIYLASDHAGFSLKEAVKERLSSSHEVIDCGALEYKEGDDYPPLMADAARRVSADSYHDPSVAILFGGSGTGEAIVANRFPHVRAVVYNGSQLEIVRLGRDHNDANVLSVGARFVSEDEAHTAIDMFLSTPFSHDERHVERIIDIEEQVKSVE